LLQAVRLARWMARVHALLTRLGTYPPSHPTRAPIASRVLGSVVARPVSRMPEVPRRAGKDDLAAAGTPHLPRGDERSEPLPQTLVRAAVAACRRAPTTPGAPPLLGLAAGARPACGDYLPVPTDAGERAHFDAARQFRLGRGARVSVRVVSAVKKLGHGHSRMIRPSTGLLWRRIWPAGVVKLSLPGEGAHHAVVAHAPPSSIPLRETTSRSPRVSGLASERPRDARARLQGCAPYAGRRRTGPRPAYPG
jgi:hypothetical protein